MESDWLMTKGWKMHMTRIVSHDNYWPVINIIDRYTLPVKKIQNAGKLIFCLLVWALSSHSRIFHSYGDVTITGEGLQILTYARHSWPLSSEGFFSVAHLMWHGPDVYNGHLRGSQTLAPIAEL